MRHNLGPVSEFPDGERRIVHVEGRSIGVFNLDGRFFAVRNRCPHQGGPLCEGRVFGWLESDRPGQYRYEDGRHLLECPWHGWEFDLATGQSWFDPERTRVRPYPVTVEAVPVEGRQPGPYTAESFPVTVEQACVILDLERKGAPR